MREVGNAMVPALALLALLGAGCTQHVETPLRPAELPLRSRPAWGPQVEGLQCRLRPTKRLWTLDETVTCRLDLRNRGPRLVAFDATEPIRADRIALDGRWYRWPHPETAPARVRPLAPDAEFSDLTLALPPTLQRRLDPGRHEVRVAFVLEGLELRSNPVDIEIASATR